MVTSNSRLSYSDCFDLFDQALADTAGIRIEFATEGEAMQYRVRMHTARQINRKDNRETYTVDHPMHGQSPYDELIVRIRQVDEVWWMYIQRQAVPRKVESLTEPEPNARRV